MAQAAMRNKAVAAEAKKVEQAVIAEALAAAADKPARHKETEAEVELPASSMWVRIDATLRYQGDVNVRTARGAGLRSRARRLAPSSRRP